ncbi:phenylacetate-CoA oxygenase/reductase, PaaK subunit [compost metagenome]
MPSAWTALGFCPRRPVTVTCMPVALTASWSTCSARRAQGWAEAQLHREYFTAAAAPAGEAGGFEVQLASTGQCFQVPAALSVAQVLLEAGIDIPLSCEQGICGTCVTRVLEGEPDHRDMFLTDAERARNDQFTPCCSRARSARLVLDL